MKTPHITVGLDGADIIGDDNIALQSAVDYISALGGGTVEILSGTYIMRNSLHLRSNITVRGQGESTTLWKADAVESLLSLDGDFGEEQITIQDCRGFEVGYGVSITDDRNGGFHTAVGTLIWQDENTFGVNVPMGGDYMVSNNARAATTFPVISGYNLENARVENLTIDGNKENNPLLNGCRGAGIFLYRGHHTIMTNCTVKNYHGDGISFQQSQHITVDGCTCIGNTHLGLHPGSGSQHPTIRNCHSENNGRIGLFLCWRVKHGIFENNQLIGNGETGISIGHKDTDNQFRNNRSVGNKREGILFRNESEAMAGHRNTFVENEILDNGKEDEGYGVRILGETHDLTFTDNRIGNTTSTNQKVGVFIGEKADRINLEDNDLSGNLNTDIEDARK
ncbi:MAG: right-handed parallel beta-helix repeat-containing protein [Candidatus Latescibacteria bacterium]|nr:right-handed parallel beta-helix repeat-containing protein [Candidatus Latescibacterota bacterium]MBT5831657.1 right-handed parallel beta-helix repeat-containing protein [Candidatus Latescibacterota bacterium]